MLIVPLPYLCNAQRRALFFSLPALHANALKKLKRENLLGSLFITGESATGKQQLNWKHLLARVINSINVLEIKHTQNVTLEVMLIAPEWPTLKLSTNSSKQHQRVCLRLHSFSVRALKLLGKISKQIVT